MVINCSILPQYFVIITELLSEISVSYWIQDIMCVMNFPRY